ncbi:hypothetical protein ACFPZP_12040 [Citrobacter bitternis]|uniref:Morphogenetic protein n=1 Tax=Citrobacter bitternis TaxID=1585982 RepID=A0ABW1Q1R4_9ENTR
MKERGMIFNAEMVRAILDGRKTQTRRIVKVNCMDICEKDDGSLWPWREDEENHGDYWYPCPFGEVGDRIWVRETCRAVELESGLDVVSYDAGGQDIPIKAHPLDAGLWVDLYRYRGGEGKTVPSIHMPRWASRITLEITGVRVERLNSISNESARAEGYPVDREADGGDSDPWLWFRDLWDGIYPEQSFKHNPWVWVITFQRVEGGAA